MCVVAFSLNFKLNTSFLKTTYTSTNEIIPIWSSYTNYLPSVQFSRLFYYYFFFWILKNLHRAWHRLAKCYQPWNHDEIIFFHSMSNCVNIFFCCREWNFWRNDYAACALFSFLSKQEKKNHYHYFNDNVDLNISISHIYIQIISK